MNYNSELLESMMKTKVLEVKPEARFAFSSFHSPTQYTRIFKAGWLDHKNRTWKRSFDFLLCFRGPKLRRVSISSPTLEIQKGPNSTSQSSWTISS